MLATKKAKIAAAAAVILTSACGASADGSAGITAAQVAAAQQAWGQGIVRIGRLHTQGGDVEAAAREHIEQFYAYGDRPVLFKPTLAAEDQFRETLTEALSYFVGGSIAEDKGFALAPYTDVRWENHATVIDSDSAMAMGNYYFTTTAGDEVKAEYSLGYERAEDGDLVIVLHHSSLPYDPE